MRLAPTIPLLTTLALLCSPGLRPLGATEFKAGAAQLDITPQIGTPRGGAYATIPSIGVLDPLHATAIVVEQGGERAAFVTLDVAYTPRSVVEVARRLVSDQTGIPADRVMISATDTH